MSSAAARPPRSWVPGLLLVLGALALYAVSNPVHASPYNHFVWQADAFLHGRAWFPYPVWPGEDLPQNWYLQDVFPLLDPAGRLTGRALVPFPPLPALVLVPVVAAFGLAADQEAVAIGLGALGVAIAWWMLGGLRLRTTVRALAVGIFATGTAWWWASAAGSTWYLAHLVASDVALVAVGVALRGDPGATDGRAGGRAGERSRGIREAVWPLDRRQVLVGLLLGVAATARLPLLLAAPFLVAVGPGGTAVRRLASAAAGGVVPVAALVGYTLLTTGAPIHPGYEAQYRREVAAYPALGYRPDWGLEDVRYIPGNLGIMLGSLPVVLPERLPDTLDIGRDTPVCTDPGARRSVFDVRCPLAVPVDVGTSLLLSAPGLLLVLPAFRRRGRTRLGLGTAAAVVPVAALNLAHFSQGWVQWGYRFSLDLVPFLLPMVALGAARTSDGRPRLAAFALFVAGGAVNLWGTTWGRILGW